MSTKKEIVAAVAEKLGITQLAAKEVVHNVLETIAKTLVDERRIELRNFGVFGDCATKVGEKPSFPPEFRVKTRFLWCFADYS